MSLQSRSTYPHRDDSRMIRGIIEDAASPPHAGIQLWPKDRTILEREVMEFRPFGLDEQGHAIRDLSGMSIRAVVVYLEKSLARERGASAGVKR